MTEPQKHVSVMLREVMEWLAPVAGGVYVDGTFGRGGYSKAILETNDAVVWAIDRDAEAIAAGKALLPQYQNRLHLLQGGFGAMDDLLEKEGVARVDGVALDLGVSSPQLDEAERGFSFRHDGPLDMRMGQEGETAEDAVNTLPEETLANIIYTFGEERFSRRVAKAIVAARKLARITRTGELASIIRAVVPASKDGLHPATRSFQALRIYVNKEVEELENGLKAAEGLLKTGGRMVVVTFHSIEDRIVKHFFKQRSAGKLNISRYLPQPTNDHAPAWHVLTDKPVTPREEEVRQNPRAVSAKLRAAEKIGSAGEKYPSGLKNYSNHHFIPTKVGIQSRMKLWIPACAGMRSLA